MADSKTYVSPFAAADAQGVADTHDACDTLKANPGTVQVFVKTIWKNTSNEQEDQKCCVPRVDSLVLAEKRLAHCRKRPGHVVDKLHANDKPESVLKRGIKFVSNVLHLSGHE